MATYVMRPALEKLAGGTQAETLDSPSLARVMGVGRQQNVIEHKTTRSGITEVLFQVPDPEVAKGAESLTQAKINDIKAMLKFIPPADKVFMLNVNLRLW